MTKSPFDEVVGFDLGHGETAVARVSLRPGAPVQIIPIRGKNSQITAVGKLADSRVVIGDAAVESRSVVERHLGFKVRLLGAAESRRALVDFVQRYQELLTDSHPLPPGARTYYFFGCPTGWSADEADKYLALLQGVVPNVHVVRESRAALVQAKEEHQLSADRLRASILVMDLGSSTIDVSCVLGGIHDRSLDLGTELGGHLIEKEILRRAVERSPRRDEILAFFADPRGTAERTVCEAHCREAKEKYWNSDVAPIEGRRSLIPVGNDGLGDLVVRLDAGEMESILTAPLPELGGRSWKESFVTFLQDIRSRLEERNAIPRTVIVTGGVSNMSFVRDLATARFPEAELVWCRPPEESVALGLARWGRIQLQTNAFSDEVTEFCRTVVPDIVLRESGRLRSSLAEALAPGIIADVVTPAVREWRAGVHRTLEAMNEAIVQQTGAWIRSPAAVAAIEGVYMPILESINAEVDRRTGDICRKHDVPPGSLLLRLEREVKSDGLSVAMGTPFDGVLGAAIGMNIVALLVFNGIAKGILVTAPFAIPGWLVAGLVISMASMFGLVFAGAALTEVKIPTSVRRLFLSDKKLNKIVAKAAPELREKLEKTIGEEDMAAIRDAVVNQVSTFLNERANEVKWIIS